MWALGKKLLFGSVTTAGVVGVVSSTSGAQQTQDHDEHLKLRFVEVIHRHGARTPTNYMHDETKEKFAQKWGKCPRVHDDGTVKDKPCALGDLTFVGAAQLKSFGTRLRERYVDSGFLPHLYDPSALHVRCTNFTRTTLSVLHLFYGLYPEGMETKTSKSFLDSIQRRTNANESLFPNYYACKRLREHFDDLKSSRPQAHLIKQPEVMAAQQEIHDVLQLPWEKKIYSFVHLHDFIKCGETEGHSFPHTLSPALKQHAITAATHILHMFLHADGPSMRLAAGPLLTELFTRIDEKIAVLSAPTPSSSSSVAASPPTPQPMPNMIVYSAHDTTLAPLAYVLGVTDYEWPKFAANLILELVEDTSIKGDDRWMVRLLYNERAKALVPYKLLKSSMASHLHVDWINECQPTQTVPQTWFEWP